MGPKAIFDSTLGYPGEGPPRRRKSRKGPPRSPNRKRGGPEPQFSKAKSRSTDTGTSRLYSTGGSCTDHTCARAHYHKKRRTKSTRKSGAAARIAKRTYLNSNECKTFSTCNKEHFHLNGTELPEIKTECALDAIIEECEPSEAELRKMHALEQEELRQEIDELDRKDIIHSLALDYSESNKEDTSESEYPIEEKYPLPARKDPSPSSTALILEKIGKHATTLDPGSDPEPEPDAPVGRPRILPDYQTEVVEVPLKGTTKGSWYKTFGRFTGWLATTITFGTLAGIHSDTMDVNEMEDSNYYMGYFGGQWGRVRGNYLDLYREKGYDRLCKLTVYSTLLDLLLNSNRSIPCSLTKDGEITDRAMSAIASVVRQDLPDWWSGDGSRNHPIIRSNTIVAYHRYKVFEDMVRRNATDTRMVPFSQYFGSLDEPIVRGVFKIREVSTPFKAEGDDNGNVIFRSVNSKQQLAEASYEVPGSYKSAHAGFMHNGSTLRDDPANMLYALRRFTECRVNYEVETRLRQNQTEWVANNQNLIRIISAHVDETMHYNKDSYEMRQSTADMERAKKALYQQVFADLDEFQMLYDEGNTANEVRLKIGEWMKHGKYARLFVNLGVPMSLVGGELLDRIKTALAKPLTYKGFTIKFVKSVSEQDLRQWVSDLVNEENVIYIHSDDGSYAYRQHGVVHYYNVDIKSCDKSHTPAMFAAFSSLFGVHQDLYHELYKQLLKPLIFTSRNSPVVLHATLREPFLLSGHTFTTSINTFSMMLMALHFIDNGMQGMEGIQRAGAELGYVLTVEKCERLPLCQFLKYSPVRVLQAEVDGKLTREPLIQSNWWFMRNLGTLFRSMGVSRGDLAGSGSIDTRASTFIHLMVKSTYPDVQCVFLDALYSRFPIEERNRVRIQRQVDELRPYNLVNGKVKIFVSGVDALSRYNIRSQADMLLDQINSLSPGVFVNSTVVAKILALDYGLGTAPLFEELEFDEGLGGWFKLDSRPTVAISHLRGNTVFRTGIG